MKISEFLQEENGKFSITRLSILLLLATYIFSVLYLVITQKTIPDIPTNMFLIFSSVFGAKVLKDRIKGININIGGRNEGN